MKILLLLPSLTFGRAARQAILLARNLCSAYDLRICILHGDEIEIAQREQLPDVPVQVLRRKRLVDPKPLWQLHRLLKEFEPDHILAWKVPCLRALGLVGRRYLRRTFISQPLSSRQAKVRLPFVDRWLLGRVAKVIASGRSEAETLIRLGISAEKIAVIAPGVDVSVKNGLGSPRAGFPKLVLLGPLEGYKGVSTAISAMDYLAFLFPEVRLLLVGSAADQVRLNAFVQAKAHARCIELLGERSILAEILHGADACLVPSLTATGTQGTLDALAAGCPVIASDLPHLRELVEDGVHGFLVPPGEPHALARRARTIIDDSALRRRLSEAAFKRARSFYSADNFVNSYRQLLKDPFQPWINSHRVRLDEIPGRTTSLSDISAPMSPPRA